MLLASLDVRTASPGSGGGPRGRQALRLDRMRRTPHNIFMRNPHRRAISVSLPVDLIEKLDRRSERTGSSRSAVVEDLLRSGARHRSHSDLNLEIEAYYAGRDADDR